MGKGLYEIIAPPPSLHSLSSHGRTLHQGVVVEAGGDVSSSGAVPSVGGSCFVAGAGRRRRFIALRPRARVRCRVHAIEDGPLAAR